jgi:hypothetical protein
MKTLPTREFRNEAAGGQLRADKWLSTASLDQVIILGSPAEGQEGWLTGLEPVTPRSTIKGSLVLSESQQQVAAPSNSVCTRVCTSQAESAHETASAAVPEATVDDDLAAVVHAWPNLPSPVRAGIVAMIRAASTAK